MVYGWKIGYSESQSPKWVVEPRRRWRWEEYQNNSLRFYACIEVTFSRLDLLVGKFLFFTLSFCHSFPSCYEARLSFNFHEIDFFLDITKAIQLFQLATGHVFWSYQLNRFSSLAFWIDYLVRSIGIIEAPHFSAISLRFPREAKELSSDVSTRLRTVWIVTRLCGSGFLNSSFFVVISSIDDRCLYRIGVTYICPSWHPPRIL